MSRPRFTLRRQVLAAALLAAPVASGAAVSTLGAQESSPPPVLGARDAAIAGVFAVSALGASTVDRSLADRLQRPEVQQNHALATTAVVFRQAAQPGMMIGLPLLWGIGALVDDRTTAAIGLHGTEAITIAALAVGGVKMVAGRARPSVPGRDPTSWRFGRGFREGSEYRSFPSGHTATAFAAASLITSELAAQRSSLRWSAGVPLYLAAGAVGWARMYENRHWASDVVAGAGIGTITGTAVARWHRTRPDNSIDRRLLGVGMSVTPAGPRLALTTLSAPARRTRR